MACVIWVVCARDEPCSGRSETTVRSPVPYVFEHVDGSAAAAFVRAAAVPPTPSVAVTATDAATPPSTMERLRFESPTAPPFPRVVPPAAGSSRAGGLYYQVRQTWATRPG